MPERKIHYAEKIQEIRIVDYVILKRNQLRTSEKSGKRDTIDRQFANQRTALLNFMETGILYNYTVRFHSVGEIVRRITCYSTHFLKFSFDVMF